MMGGPDTQAFSSSDFSGLSAPRVWEAFEEAPAFMAVLRGPHHIYEMANASYRQLVGPRNYLRQPVSVVSPTAQEMGLLQIMDDVYNTGRPFVAQNFLAVIEKDTSRRRMLLNLCYSPIRADDGSVWGIVIEGTVEHYLDQGRSGKGSADLTPRELEVLYWVASGKTAETIGDILNISTRTVASYMSSTLEKLDATNQPHAVSKAFRLGILQQDGTP